ncbi:MAG: alpha-amylase family glycosyl hydrolase [Halanaerobiales bacterium]|nr:alpha-amylase family glycosyl hydrolase [Halanaerobiales bacterium]
MKSINEIDLKELKNNKDFSESPNNWEDQIIYFLIVDRFSDGKEDQRELYDPNTDFDSVVGTENEGSWQGWGDKWNGGNLKGVISKLDYLKELGITVLWLSPVLKQVAFHENYHGYGTQNFLAIDPHLGNKEDLKKLVEEAHKRDMYVILDIIINHSGDVYGYKEGNPSWTGEQYELEAFRDENGHADIDPNNIDIEKIWPDGAVWPKEMQSKDIYERKGEILNWEYYPEYIQGDFMSFKTHFLGRYSENEGFMPSQTLNILTKVYKYWILETDIDGYRMDSVKHLDWGATRHFVREIHEFTKSIGKMNFCLIGEITGGFKFAYDTVTNTGLDAALGINDIPNRLEGVPKGITNPEEYFNIFTNNELLGEGAYKWFKDNVVTMFDDHDMVSLSDDYKYRFCAEKETSSLLANAVMFNVTTLGIPCMYYGTEQGFDGSGNSDKYIRETMFGGKFGAFRTQNKHFFNQNSDIYQKAKEILNLRKENTALRHGRQYLRSITYSKDSDFFIPNKSGEERITDIIGWSRVLSDEEFILAINNDLENKKEVYIKVDPYLNNPDDIFKCIYSSSEEQIKEEVKVVDVKGNLAIKINVENKGRVVYKRI